MRINTKVIGFGAVLCLLAGGVTTLAEAAGESAPTGPTVTGIVTTNPSGPAPSVNGVPINPTTGALPQGALGSGPAKQGTIASTPGPTPEVNGVPIDPTTGAMGHGTVVATYIGPDSAAIASGAAARHQVHLACFKSLVHAGHKVRIAPACR
jgi:hypothetical protein